jgi:hypothetical protein
VHWDANLVRLRAMLTSAEGNLVARRVFLERAEPAW